MEEQVLHGCLQFVLWSIRLIPQTDEIPVINSFLITNEFYKVSVGAKTSRYDPNDLGYRRATITYTKWSKHIFIYEQIIKISDIYEL